MKKQKPEPQYPTRILREPEARARSGIKSKSVFRKAWQRGELPRPFKITETGRLLGWYDSEWDVWEQERKAKRDAGAAS